jgi:SAM-dependent methyltransferase
MTVITYDHLAEEYYDPDHQTCRNFDVATAAALPSVRDKVPADGLILEVGCGRGRCKEFLGVEPNRIVQLDASQKMLALPNREDCLLKLHGDASSIPFVDAQFAAVIGFLVDPFLGLQFLAEARKVLRPGGLLLFTTPTTDWGHALRGSKEPNASYATFITRDKQSIEVPSNLIPKDRLQAMLWHVGFSDVTISTHPLPQGTKPISSDVEKAARNKGLTVFSLPLICVVTATSP